MGRSRSRVRAARAAYVMTATEAHLALRSTTEPPSDELGTLPATSTDKQRRFVEEYCVDFNATQAAIRAGYSQKTAHAIGWENLRKPEIRAALRAKLDGLTMSAAEAAMRLTRWGRGSLNPFVRITADGQAIIDLSTAEAQDAIDLIKKIKTTENTTTSKDGAEHTTTRTEIELHDAKDAVVQMAKLHSMFREDEADAVRVKPTREEVEDTWKRLQRVKSIEELERMMVAHAEKQIADGVA